MRRTLFLHIGAHRTATTSIQRFLRANTAALAARGILNPDGEARHHRLSAWMLAGEAEAAAAALTAAADQAARAARRPVDRIVLSDEDLCARTDLARLRPLARVFDLRVIYVIRRQDLWLESWYRQNVKWQWNPDLAHLTFAEFLARRRSFFWIDYEATVARLERLFGAGAVELMVFEAAEMPEGPVAAFARALGLDDLDGLALGQHANGSLSALTTEFMRHLPLHEIPERRRKRVEAACVRMDWHVRRHFGAQSPHYLDAAARAAVLEPYAPGNARLARHRFGRDLLFREPLPPADAPLAPTALPADPAALMQVFVAPLVQYLAEAEAAAAEDGGEDGEGGEGGERGRRGSS
jgi:hypothetical protein